VRGLGSICHTSEGGELVKRKGGGDNDGRSILYVSGGEIRARAKETGGWGVMVSCTRKMIVESTSLSDPSNAVAAQGVLHSSSLTLYPVCPGHQPASSRKLPNRLNCRSSIVGTRTYKDKVNSFTLYRAS